MRLYLVRHAIAVPPGTAGFTRDAQRPLTREGHTQARHVARGLRQLAIRPDLIVTSPYLRAVQTAEHLARVLGPRIPIQAMVALRAEAKPHEASLALKPLGVHEHVFCVGHEPHLSAWLAELVAGHRGLHCLVKKGGVACVELEQVPPPPGSGLLRWLMTPKQLSMMGP